jgi:hypothetical protein
VRLYAAFYDCRALNRRKDVGGTIRSVDRDVAMLVNVRLALRFNDVVFKTR